MKLTLNDINSWDHKIAEELLWELIASRVQVVGSLSTPSAAPLPPLREEQII